LQMTYQWFVSIPMLLGAPKKAGEKWLLYHSDQKGFYHTHDVSNPKYLLMDSQVQSNIPGRTNYLMEAMKQLDHMFEAHWFCTSFMDPNWSMVIPNGHSKCAILQICANPPTKNLL
jgi:hypothetical protein